MLASLWRTVADGCALSVVALQARTFSVTNLCTLDWGAGCCLVKHLTYVAWIIGEETVTNFDWATIGVASD